MCQGFGRILTKGFRTDFPVCYKIAAEIFIINRYCNAGNDSLKTVYDFFNFSQLNSKSAKLDLVIYSSEKFNFTFRGNLCKITGLICSFAIKRNKDISCFLRQIDIAPAHAKTCNYKLSCFSIWKDFIFFVNHVNLNITIWCTNGDIFAVRDHLHGTAYGSFCRSIAIHNIGIWIYRADLIIECRRKGFCAYIKHFNSGSCFPKLGQINHIRQISRCGGHNIHTIFQN